MELDRLEEMIASGKTVVLRDGLYSWMSRALAVMCLLPVLASISDGKSVVLAPALLALAGAAVWFRLAVKIQKNRLVARNLFSTIEVLLPAKEATFEFDDWKIYVVDGERRRFVKGVTGPYSGSGGRHLPGFGRRYEYAEELLERFSPGSTRRIPKIPFSWPEFGGG